jgi:hypothetical protein
LPKEKRRFIRIKIIGHEKIESTADHPYLVAELNDKDYKKSWEEVRKIIKWKKAEELSVNDHILLPKIEHKYENNIIIDVKDYLNCNYIEKEERIFLARKLPWKKNKKVIASNSNSIPSKIIVDERFCKFIGWFIAEGHYSQSSYVRLTFNYYTEQEIARELSDYIKEVFEIDSRFEKIESNGGVSLRLEFGSKLLSIILEKMVGKYSENKHLPEWFVKLKPELLKIMIDSHYSGDKGITISKRLARELFFARHLLHQKSYFGENHGEGYEVIENSSSTNTVAKPIDNYVAYRIFGIESFFSSDKVYNFSVEKEDSYIVNGAIVHNCKGITVYRDGCRTGVLVRENKDTNNNKTDFKLNKTDAPKRPKSLECDVHHIKVQGEEYFVLVGMFHGEVYEIFAGKNGMISKEVKKGEIKKIKRGHYQAILDNGEIIDNVCDFITDDQAAITRLASLSLRHGSDIKHCVTSLEKVPGDMTSLAKSMARALKKYIKDGEKQTGIECGSCGSENMIRQEGCITCRNCGWSKCS